MISFASLVQNKRRKMLALVLLLSLAVLVRESDSISLTYILKKGETIQPSCIADDNERYSAIGWVHPLPQTKEKLPKIVTKFLPDLKSSFNCKFEKNDKCIQNWAISNWKIDENSWKTTDLLLDKRWEDLATIFTGNDSKEFDFRTEIFTNNNTQISFSVVAMQQVEILLCEGWNPYDYSCYSFEMSQTNIKMRKYAKYSKQSDDLKYLQTYEAFAKILTEREWRNFIFALDDKGMLTMTDVNVNRVAIEYLDKKPLKPLYFFIKSSAPAIWKIHKNHFLYTKKAQLSRLGPFLKVSSKNFCTSLFVSLCNNCVMDFLIRIDGKRKILKQVVGNNKKNDWQLIKLKYENYPFDNITIFTHTKFVSNETMNETEEGFWAIDDARLCHENEVKVTFLNFDNNQTEIDDDFIDGVSCQVVKQPNWRPKRIVYPEIKDFPSITSTADQNSINLTWPEEDSEKRIKYFITYEANDICTSFPFNSKRIKSSGFLTTNFNELTIKNLVPYTKYNISFASILHEKEKHSFITTLEPDEVTLEELPKNLQIQLSDTSAHITWDTIDCENIYGHLLYSLSINNTESNISKELEVKTENTVQIVDLMPYTEYTLNIKIARSFAFLNSSTKAETLSTTFRTKAGLASKVENLEVYSTDSSSISLRYNLGESSRGVPVFVQVKRCSTLGYGKCRLNQTRIMSCKLWPNKFCVDVPNLMPNLNFTVGVSVKNDHTYDFGPEINVTSTTIEREPAPPINITYESNNCRNGVDFCNLEINWMHPNYPNGAIQSFHLVLNSSNGVKIQEIYEIRHKEYLPKYTKQIKFLPYSSSYDLYIQSANILYKSDFVYTKVYTDEISNQMPKLTAKNDYSATFRTVSMDKRLQSYQITVLVQDYNKNISIPDEIQTNRQFADNLCHKYGKTWLAQIVFVNNSHENFDIGNKNDPLQAATNYCVIFIITNRYKNSEKAHQIVYYNEFKTDEAKLILASPRKFNQLYGLLLLLLLIPIGYYVYTRFYKKNKKPISTNEIEKENEYETLPFDDCEFNCVSNDTYNNYNQLVYK